nr:hypothetical protein [Pseudomonas karstica]
MKRAVMIFLAVSGSILLVGCGHHRDGGERHDRDHQGRGYDRGHDDRGNDHGYDRGDNDRRHDRGRDRRDD